MRIAIIGAGAIGSALGALLARSGQDVTLIGRPAHVAAIHRDGLQVDGYLGEFMVQVQAAECLDFRPDLTLLTVKTQDVIAAVQDNLPYLTDGPLVTLQNGVRSDELVASLLLNNAGYAEIGPLEESRPDEIHRQFETNTFGPLRLAQLVLPTMRAQHGGRIVNVSTMGGRVAIPFTGLYNGSKFALEGMSDALRIETRPFGIHVILVEPGGVRTNFNSVATQRAQRFATDRHSPYQRYFERLNRFIAQASVYSPPPETVAQVILRALTARRPRARYVATWDARLMLAIVPRLSDGLRDVLWSRLLGLRAARTG